MPSSSQQQSLRETVAYVLSGAATPRGATPEQVADAAVGVVLSQPVETLLRDLRQWDHLPDMGDGPYFLSRIDKALAVLAGLRDQAIPPGQTEERV